MKRTDVHSPSNIVPENYSFVAAMCVSDQDFGMLAHQRQIFQEHMAHTGAKFSSHEHGGHCHVCGAHCKDYAIFHYHPTNVYIKTGFDCAEKLDQDIDSDIFKRVTTERQAMEKAKAGKLKATGLLREQNVLEAVLKTTEDLNRLNADVVELVKNDKVLYHAHLIVVDLVRNLVKYGGLSDKQWNFLKSKLDAIVNHEARVEEIAKQKEATPEAPEGKVTVKGVVVSVRFTESMYGVQHRFTVKTEEGWVVHSTVPSAISDVKKGAVVQFNATLNRDEKDHTVAFAKRPTKAQILEEVVA